MDKYIKHLEKNNYSKNTINTYRSILLSYIDVFHDIRLIKSKLKEIESKPNTVSTHYSILHAFMKFNNDRRIRSLEEFKLPHKPNIFRAVFTKDFLYKRTENLQDRRCAIIRFMFETGIRAAELGSIIGITESTITVKGKGNKIREIFHNIETTSQIVSFKISTKTLRLWVKDVLGEEFTPHSIRRSHATHLLLNGANPKMVMLQLGHSKIETTYRYLNASKELNQSIYNEHF